MTAALVRGVRHGPVAISAATRVGRQSVDQPRSPEADRPRGSHDRHHRRRGAQERVVARRPVRLVAAPRGSTGLCLDPSRVTAGAQFRLHRRCQRGCITLTRHRDPRQPNRPFTDFAVPPLSRCRRAMRRAGCSAVVIGEPTINERRVGAGLNIASPAVGAIASRLRNLRGRRVVPATAGPATLVRIVVRDPSVVVILVEPSAQLWSPGVKHHEADLFQQSPIDLFINSTNSDMRFPANSISNVARPSRLAALSALGSSSCCFATRDPASAVRVPPSPA